MERQARRTGSKNRAETIKRRFNFIFGAINRYRVPHPGFPLPFLLCLAFLVINVSHKRGTVPACTETSKALL